jgi:hypothetical protein
MSRNGFTFPPIPGKGECSLTFRLSAPIVYDMEDLSNEVDYADIVDCGGYGYRWMRTRRQGY